MKHSPAIYNPLFLTLQDGVGKKNSTSAAGSHTYGPPVLEPAAENSRPSLAAPIKAALVLRMT
jgi:hypothetical protein